MLIPVTLSPASSSNPKLPTGLAQISHAEVVLIELQGALEVDAAHPHERDGKLVGTLTLDMASNKPSLLIGNHLLEGKIAALPKPYAVLVRNARGAGAGYRAASSDSDAMEVDAIEVDDDAERGTMGADADTTPDSEANTGWTICGIVKKKIIFSKRPMPVIGKKMQ